MRLSTRLTLRWPTPLGRVAARLAEFLLRPRAPLWRHVLLLWPLAMLPSTLLLFAGVTVGILLGWTEAELLGDHLAPTPIDPFIALAVAPVVETLLLPIGLRLARLFTTRRLLVAAGSALLWGLLHGLEAPVRFAGSAWCFFVFGAAYQAWRPRSFGHAFVAAAGPHLLLNGTVVLVQRAWG